VHLFTTTRTVAPGRTGEALAFAVTAARDIETASGLAVSAWINVYGAPPDTITFAACARSRAAIGDAFSLLQQGDGVRLVGRTGTDAIGEVVAHTGRGRGGPAFAAIVTAQCEPGRVADAIAWTVDTSNDIARLADLRTLVVRELYGPWATVSRITLAPTLADLDGAEQNLPTDLRHLEHVDECAGWFVPGSVHQRLVRRLGTDVR
jgi:hypothetical protein